MILEYNLQFFAKDGPGGEKTEPATAKKLSDARKEGQVAKSKEVASSLTLMALFVVLQIWLSGMGTRFMGLFETIYGAIPDTIINYGGDVPAISITLIVRQAMVDIMILIAPFLISAFVISVVADVVQVKWKPTAKPLKPKFSKLNPVNGVKRLFSLNSLMELVKSIVKVGVMITIAYTYLRKHFTDLFILYDLTLWAAIALVGSLVIGLGIRIAAFYLLVAAADYAFQKWKFGEDMKMTKQEVKDEYKNQEGDPQIKSKQRQRMQEASRRRMMQSLPQADVVITNPTHYAVAIKYDPDGELDAPYVVAKGADHLAQRIKDVAKENRIEIVENKPLARMLYANVEIGQAVPPELYQAVAEVLAFVYHLQGKV